MKMPLLPLHLLGACAGAALLTACGTQPMQPSSVPSFPAGAAQRLTSSSGDLLYFNGRTPPRQFAVFILSYPAGKALGMFAGGLLGLCSDSSGDVFITDAESITEYAHGGEKPIAELGDGNNHPQGCAIDPKTGDLAAVGAFLGDGTANVTVFPWLSSGGRFGGPTTYTDSSATALKWCTYDDKGNLFANGYTEGSSGQPLFLLHELPKKRASIQRVTVDKLLYGGGAIQWDGTYLVLGDPNPDKGRGPTKIFQLKVSGTMAKVVHEIELTDSEDKNDAEGDQFWIQGDAIVTPESARATLAMWPYPAGGKPIKQFRAHRPWGVTVSVGS